MISDTGPLSYLHRLGHLGVIKDVYQRILVPPAVVAELDAGHRRGFDLPDVAALSWIEVSTPKARELAGIDGVGPGETEAIALGRSISNALLLSDDRRAREIAVTFRLRVTGTVGLLILAKERQMIERLRPELDRLLGFGFRLAPNVHQAALRRAGE